MAISQADRDWFCDRLRENWTSLYRLARSITGSDADAQEVMAQAAYLAWARFGQLRQREKFRFWLLKIAANEARQLCRRRRGRTVPLEELGTEPAAPEREPEDHSLWQAVQALPRDQREAVVLFYWEDLPTEEIARIVGAAPGTVRVRLSRAREQLRKWLEVERDG
ncbi:RNA polymerase sigma factor [Dysosmobacter sp. Marseille-Q4140]|nr:RNA polymerase sigma factor [Dysosmobacter sp. Marseille-Q4140]